MAVGHAALQDQPPAAFNIFWSINVVLFFQNLEKRKRQASIAILVVMVVVAVLYVISKKPNPEIGHWTTSPLAYQETLDIYDDGIASYNGYRCTWKELSKYTLRLQCSIGENKMIYEFNNGVLHRGGDSPLGETSTFTKTP